MKNEKSTPQNDWVPCEPGALVKLANEQNALSRRAAISKMSMGVMAIAAAGTATMVYVASGNKTKPSIGSSGIKTTPVARISCKQVICLLPKYLEETIDDDELLARIDNHLEHCGYCCDQRDKMQA